MTDPTFNPRPGVWTPEQAKAYTDGWRDRTDGRVVPPPKRDTPRGEGFYDADVKIREAAKRAMHGGVVPLPTDRPAWGVPVLVPVV